VNIGFGALRDRMRSFATEQSLVTPSSGHIVSEKPEAHTQGARIDVGGIEALTRDESDTAANGAIISSDQPLGLAGVSAVLAFTPDALVVGSGQSAAHGSKAFSSKTLLVSIQVFRKLKGEILRFNFRCGLIVLSLKMISTWFPGHRIWRLKLSLALRVWIASCGGHSKPEGFRVISHDSLTNRWVIIRMGYPGRLHTPYVTTRLVAICSSHNSGDQISRGPH
jgi:hypothetical protein